MTNNTDNTAPSLALATVDRSSLVLRYDEALDTASETGRPPASRSRWVARTVAISTVDYRRDGSRVDPGFAAVSRSDVVTVSYTVPNARARFGMKRATTLAALSGQAVFNQSLSGDNAVFYSTLLRSHTLSRTVGAGRNDPAERRRAQKFTTGSAAHGYVLESAVIAIDAAGADAMPRVAITTDDSGDPGTTLYTLQPPPGVATGELTFLAPADSTLEPDTSYWILVSNGNTQDQDAARFTLRYTRRDGVDGGGLPGWSVAPEGEWARGPAFATWAVERDAIGWGVGILHELTGVLASDATAPVLSTAAVSGTSLVLTYDEDLDPASEARGRRLHREVGRLGRDGQPGGRARHDRNVLTLASAIGSGSSTVTVSYDVPAANPIRDLARNAVAALTNRPVATSNAPPSVRLRPRGHGQRGRERGAGHGRRRALHGDRRGRRRDQLRAGRRRRESLQHHLRRPDPDERRTRPRDPAHLHRHRPGARRQGCRRQPVDRRGRRPGRHHHRSRTSTSRAR